MTRQPIAVDVKTAAEMTGVSPQTISRAIKATGSIHLKAKRLGTKRLIAVKDLERWHQSLPDA